MSNDQELKYNKIADLIKDSVEEFDNHDALVWHRIRKDEIIDPIQGVFTGSIPKWIKGSLIQNGPGTFQIGDVTLNHAFDGMAMLHRFNIDSGNVTYQCRFVQSEAFKAIKTQNRMAFNEFGTNTISNGNIFQKIRSWFAKEGRTDNTLVTVFPIDQDMFAFTETPLIRRFDPVTLETLECHDLAKSTKIVLMPSHAQVYDGNLYNCGTSISSEGSYYIIFCVPEGAEKFDKVKVIAKVPAKRKFSPSYMHSFGITENYFIIIEQALVLPAMDMKLSSYTRKPFCEVLKWLENQNNHIHLVDRVTGEVKYSFETEQFMYFHTINQFEKEGHVVFDVICYKDAQLVKGLMINHLEKLQKEKIRTNMMNNRPLRFVLPLTVPDEQNSNQNLISLKDSEAVAFKNSDGTIFCAPEILCDYSVEFGSVWYEKHMGRPYRYFYSVGFDIYTEYPGKLIKCDTETKDVLIWKEENVSPSEPIFIPSNDPKSEDDGVVVSALLYGGSDSNRVTLLVLDATTFKELGRCEFKDLSDPVPKTFHGWFVDGRK